MQVVGLGATEEEDVLEEDAIDVADGNDGSEEETKDGSGDDAAEDVVEEDVAATAMSELDNEQDNNLAAGLW